MRNFKLLTTAALLTVSSLALAGSETFLATIEGVEDATIAEKVAATFIFKKSLLELTRFLLIINN